MKNHNLGDRAKTLIGIVLAAAAAAICAAIDGIFSEGEGPK